MPVEHIRPQIAKGPSHRRQRREVEWVRITPHGEARDAEGEAWTQALEKLVRPGSSARGVAQDADLVATVDLAPGYVENVTEQAPNGGAEDVQDSEARLARHGGNFGDPAAVTRPRRAVNVQNQRSLTMIVSPGFNG
jgi:hypothetical protein